MKRLDIAQASKEVRAFLEIFKGEEEVYLLEDQGEPILGIVPSWQVRNLEEQRTQLLEMLREVWAKNRNVSPEEVARDVEEAIREVRRKP